MWCAVKDYPNYEVSSTGQVKNIRQKLLKGRHSKTKDGKIDPYLRVILYNDEGYKCFSIHSLVANHFLEKIEGCDIDHIDRIPENNNVENLRWVSRSVNNLNRAYYFRRTDGLHNIHKAGFTFIIKFCVNKKIIIVGKTHDIDEAIKIRDEYISNNPR